MRRSFVNPDLLFLAGMYLFALLIALAFVFQRLRWRLRSRLGRKDPGFYPSSASLGYAFHQLQTLAEPSAQYVVAEMVDEEKADDDEQGGAADPTAHLLRQAARIRRGEGLERLTATADVEAGGGVELRASQVVDLSDRVSAEADSLRE